MKKLIISGKADSWRSIEELKKKNAEIWMCGTDQREGGDLHFELHGIEIKNHKNVIYELPEEVYTFGLPINNTISALCVYAWLLGYKWISIVGAPMNSSNEYLEQRPALAYVIGWLSAKGVKINWSALPRSTDYGKKEKKKNGKEYQNIKKN